MRVVIQRVTEANVKIEGNIAGQMILRRKAALEASSLTEHHVAYVNVRL